ISCFSLIFVSCRKKSSPSSTTRYLSAKTETVTVYIKGMHCQGCVMAIREKLKKQKGVTNAMVSLKPQRAVVSFVPSVFPKERLLEIVRKLHYKASFRPWEKQTAQQPAARRRSAVPDRETAQSKPVPSSPR
ncbi:MAG: heavy metal-associated domain-containing protein, partial [Myxococcota bacterium]